MVYKNVKKKIQKAAVCNDTKNKYNFYNKKKLTNKKVAITFV